MAGPWPGVFRHRKARRRQRARGQPDGPGPTRCFQRAKISNCAGAAGSRVPAFRKKISASRGGAQRKGRLSSRPRLRDLGGLAGGVTGAQDVERHRRGDLPRPQCHPPPRLTTARSDPRFSGQVVGHHHHPVALADRLGGAGGEHPERGDLHPPGDAIPTRGTGGQVHREAQFDAVGAVTGGETARVVAEPAGDGDADRVHELASRGALPGRAGRLRVATWDWGALPGGLVPAPPRKGTAHRPAPGRAKMVPPRASPKVAAPAQPAPVNQARGRGKICGRPGVSAAKGRLRDPTQRRNLAQPGEGTRHSPATPGPPSPGDRCQRIASVAIGSRPAGVFVPANRVGLSSNRVCLFWCAIGSCPAVGRMMCRCGRATRHGQRERVSGSRWSSPTARGYGG